MRPDYLLLGHFTRDLLPDGTFAPGGTALYAGLAAARLGQRVAVVSAPSSLPATWPAENPVAFTASPTAPIFENRYTPASRQQLLHADAPPLDLADIPPAWRAAPIVHLGPVLAEIPESLVFAFPKALLGVTPQGWMRAWSPPLPAPVRYRRWAPLPELLRRIDALVLSIEDVQGDERLPRAYARHCRLVALTRGAAGATVFVHGRPHDIPAVPVDEHDPTGAGDVFAAALLVRLRETGEPLVAAAFAAEVAAQHVARAGRDPAAAL